MKGVEKVEKYVKSENISTAVIISAALLLGGFVLNKFNKIGEHKPDKIVTPVTCGLRNGRLGVIEMGYTKEPVDNNTSK